MIGNDDDELANTTGSVPGLDAMGLGSKRRCRPARWSHCCRDCHAQLAVCGAKAATGQVWHTNVDRVRCCTTATLFSNHTALHRQRLAHV